jgi:hypothetical protein
VFISSSSLCFCSDVGLGFLGFGGGRDIRSLQVPSSRHLWVKSILLGNRGLVHFLRFLALENADAFQILGRAVFSSRMGLLCQNVLLDKHLSLVDFWEVGGSKRRLLFFH